MKEFIEYLVKQVATNSGAVQVTPSDEIPGETSYNITVAPEDMGIIIGKGGNTIRSIRNLAKAKAIKDNVRIRVMLNETDENYDDNQHN